LIWCSWVLKTAGNSKTIYAIFGKKVHCQRKKTAGSETSGMLFTRIVRDFHLGFSRSFPIRDKLLPRKKPQLTSAYALAAEMLGFKIVYLEAGSGSEKIPTEHIANCSQILNIPLIAGGGVDNKEDARAFVEAGADILELGFPFSDPIADGPTIQAAANRSLNAGTTPQAIFDIVKEIG